MLWILGGVTLNLARYAKLAYPRPAERLGEFSLPEEILGFPTKFQTAIKEIIAMSLH